MLPFAAVKRSLNASNSLNCLSQLTAATSGRAMIRCHMLLLAERGRCFDAPVSVRPFSDVTNDRYRPHALPQLPAASACQIVTFLCGFKLTLNCLKRLKPCRCSHTHTMPIIRPHRSINWMRIIATNTVAWSPCRCVFCILRKRIN